MGRAAQALTPGGACQNAQMISNAPLTETEIERLEVFLLREDGGLNQPMNMAMIDGFLAAVVSGPGLIMPGEWMRWIWDTENGQETPEFQSQQEAQDILNLLMRHYQDVNDTLTHAPQDYEPLIMERTVEGRVIPIIDEWCMGYYKGMSLDLASWLPLLMTQAHPLGPILRYGTEEGWELLKGQKPDLDEHQAFADQLAPAAREVHAHWLAQRREQQARGEMPEVLRRQEPLRKAAKVGRNEACPCGSGRKYKHCHGLN